MCHHCNDGDPDQVWNLKYCPDGKSTKEKKWKDHLKSPHIPEVEFTCLEVVYQEGPPEFDDRGKFIPPYFDVEYHSGHFIIKNVRNPKLGFKDLDVLVEFNNVDLREEKNKTYFEADSKIQPNTINTAKILRPFFPEQYLSPEVKVSSKRHKNCSVV